MTQERKEIWKEFFRLKYVEIREFIVDVFEEYALPLIGGLLIVYTFISLIAMGTGIKNIFTFVCAGYLAGLLVLLLEVLISFLIYVLCVWLHSNWKQAKLNVKNGIKTVI